MPSKRTKDLLNVVIDVLASVEQNQLDMNDWTYDSMTSDRSLEKRQCRNKTMCGFVGCAVGWYCHAHPEAELKIENGAPTYDCRYGMEAVAKYFGIPHYAAVYLFSRPQYGAEPYVEDVIRRINQFTCDGVYYHRDFDGRVDPNRSGIVPDDFTFHPLPTE